MESTFSMEKFLRFAVGFGQKDQDASRARIFSWSGDTIKIHLVIISMFDLANVDFY